MLLDWKKLLFHTILLSVRVRKRRIKQLMLRTLSDRAVSSKGKIQVEFRVQQIFVSVLFGPRNRIIRKKKTTNYSS